MFFGYDPLGRCVKRWKGPAATGTPEYPYATYFYYEGWNLVQEGLSVASAARTYVHGARVDEIVASQVSGLWYHHHYDAQGNAILLSTTSGGLMEQYDYDAFGFPYFYDALGNKGTPRTRFLFTGREWITDLRLYDYRNRLYQPELGRFLQPDPKQFEAGDYNLYRYCHNDPVNRSDPFGLEFFDLGYQLTDFVKGADYGITQPALLTPKIILKPVVGGYKASVPKFDLRVQSEVATKARDGQTIFNRTKENIDRTVKHEGNHRENNRGWYDKNHDKVLKDLNSDKIYKDPAAAKSAIEQKLRNSFENFRKQEDTHTGPNWPNYKRPDRELPGQ
jgi:RHS repeat-associated protein